jgi:hypothetical protein
VSFVFALACLAPPGMLAQGWTLTSAPITNWQAVASSADGTKLVAVVNGGPIYTSADSGASWSITTAPTTNWTSVASSADGIKLVAGVCNGGIYASADTGATWTATSAPLGCWQALASSADGTKLVAAGYNVYTSINSGTTWTWLTNAPNLQRIASSADGTVLLGALPIDSVYLSTNAGLTWWRPPLPTDTNWVVACSADGRTLVAAGSCGGASFTIFTSTNSGAIWNTADRGFGCLSSLAASADGSRLAAVTSYDGSIYTSIDFGATWTVADAPVTNWTAVASSADGTKLVGVVGWYLGGPIYTSQVTPAPALTLVEQGTSLLLSWTVPSLDFVLQESADLTSSNWTGVTNTATLNLSNLQYQVTVPLSAVNRFYRLKH